MSAQRSDTPGSAEGASGASQAGPEMDGGMFQQCLDLLRGPTDERRFVGLLLVTRLLPNGSDEAIRRVMAALGPTFLRRLLLPLRARAPGDQQAPLDGEAASQAATGSGLALALLASGCRLPETAAGPELREHLPTLVRVVGACGVFPLVMPAASGANWTAAQNPEIAAVDSAAAADALECLVAAAAAAPRQTLAALDRAGALAALAAWLTEATAALTAPAAAAAVRQDHVEPDMVAEARHRGVLLAAALLERLLACPGGGGGSGASSAAATEATGRAVTVLAEAPAAAAKCMAALAALVGNPRLLAPPPSPPPSGQPPATPAAAAAAGTSGGAAQLQLEALHALILMLRAAQHPAAAAAEAQLRRLDGTVGWSAAARRGLGWVLRSRAPAPLRHAALEAAAHVAALAGDAWLLGRGPAAPSAAAAAPSAGPAEAPETFLVLLMETLKIEINLLLSDALHPDRRVAAEATRLSTAAAAAPPQPSERLLQELQDRGAARATAEVAAAEKAAAAAAAAAGGAADGGRTAAPQLAAGEAPMEVDGATGASTSAAASAATAGAASQPSGAAAAAAAAPPAPTVAAGDRALALLPVGYQLAEAAIGAVAADAAAADGDMELDAGGAAAAAAAAAGGAVLPEAALQNLLAGFETLAEHLLAFLDAAAELQQQQQQQQQEGPEGTAPASSPQQPPAAPPSARGGSSHVPAHVFAHVSAHTSTSAHVAPALLLGAVRLLGRYLAEAPGAVRGERLLKALPLAMSVRAPGGGGDGGRSGGDLDDTQGFGLTFLLPGLLQATAPGADGRVDVARALRTSPLALSSAVDFLCAAACSAAAAASHAARRPTAAAAAATSDMLAAEAALADAAALLLALLEPTALAKAAARRGVAAGTSGHIGATEGQAFSVGGPGAWALLQRGAPPALAAQLQAAAAVAAGEAGLDPLLAALQPCMWALQRWSQARVAAVQALSSLDPLSPAPTAASLMAASQLSPRALLPPAALAAVTLASTLRALTDASGAACGAAGAGAAALAEALLPPPLTEAVCRLALAAAAAGTSLELQQLVQADADADDTMHDDSAQPQVSYMSATGAAEDYPGDAEAAWGRLLGACSQLVELSGPMQAQAGSAGWLRRLAAVRDGRLGSAAAVAAAGVSRDAVAVARDLLAAEVGLEMLVQLVEAHG
ncbi:hypothetical protein HYH03_008412 [Edaphochlamys debaryana]|uniref:Neurochondrin n=1 Tax=Edaphochlamys debaryana TaxID=47281 RepID=A0A835Y065_9CHLO|nr:hypothetical protein HYH03_008412 [Edaphochlamys debaryana]|eukprot:KAG2493275.1 hypothetical protein HYH03_008412 [Edaphochlamys debaryana]